MYDNDILVGKIHTGIRAGDGFVIPLGDFSQINSSECFGSEFHLSGHSWNVIGWHDRAHHAGDVENLGLQLILRFRQLTVGHRHIAGAEIDCAFGDLTNSAAAANGLVIK